MFKNTFENYTLKGLSDVKASEYSNIRIELTGVYGWGVGYYSVKKLTEFHNDVYEALRKAGYSIRQTEGSGSADYLEKEGSRLCLYMHPMEFTGAATNKETQDIIRVLEDCSCFNSVRLGRTRELLDLTDLDYCCMIYDDAENIVMAMLEYKQPVRDNYDAGFDFADAMGIDRLQSPSTGCLSSDNVEISAVEDLRKAAIGIMNENQSLSNSEIAKKVSSIAQGWEAEILYVDKEIKKRTAEFHDIKQYQNFYGSSYTNMHSLLKYSGNLTLKNYRRIAVLNGFEYNAKKHKAATIER